MSQNTAVARKLPKPAPTMQRHGSELTENVVPTEPVGPTVLGKAHKRVLFVTNTNEFGGAERDLLALIRSLRGCDVQLSILCLGDDFFSERLDPKQRVDVIICKKVPKSLRDWTRLFRSPRPDVVVFIYSWFWCLPPTALIGAWLAGVRRRYSIQQLISPRLAASPEQSAQWKRRRTIRSVSLRLLGLEPRWVTDMIAAVAALPICVHASLSSPTELRISAYLCNTTICVSDALRSSLIKDFGFPAAKMRTIHNGVAISEFFPSKRNGLTIRAKLGIHPEEFLLVCTARLSEQKGIDILLQAIARVLGDGTPCKCIIVGDGPLKDQLLDQARELGLSGHVFFEGFQENVRAYLQAASVFILTSHREGLPLSIVEAMACGLPCIVTDVGGNAEAITHQVHGLVVPPGSVSGVADAISYLATHPSERAQMGAMARGKACESFDIDKRMAEIKRVILN